MIRYQNESVVVKLTNKATAILLIWKGFPSCLSYRQGLEKSLEIAKEHKIINWISDISQMQAPQIKDQEWAGREWLRKAVSAGCYKNQAVIMAKDFFGDVADLNFTTTIQNLTLEFRHFTSLEDAKEWLEDIG